ncbi:condensation domain-containing protein [Rhizobium tubonense]|uniref:Condensation protein n=1 Tax=Rhizobium tubonense TaxID=484088 RepID=A0A2W4C8I2_9HYPH|nr:condensation domain-containing protein [Rhizobium tubonense]PZM07425.1 condensation protein [Rhizobium tubonense]
MTTIETSTTRQDENLALVGEFPCTQTQLRCWILDQLNPGNPALNVAVRWEIRGTFKAANIEAAFRKVIQRHEVLRTRLVETDGKPVQQVVEQIDFRMAEIDLRNMAPEQRQKRILSIGEETAQAPFNLGKAGLFRVSLLMVENDFGVLLITAHQSCFDGWSIRVLGREVGEIAAAIDAGRAPVLPELPLQYGDYALWQQEYLESYGFEMEKTFWREKLVGAPYFEVPPDHPRASVKTNHGDIVSVAQPIEFSERMDAAARKHRVSQYAYGAAIASVVLRRFTQADTVLFGSQVAGREHADLENLIGVFINNLVLRFDFNADTSLSDHFQSVRETVEAVLNHQKVPFNKLVELINPVRDPSRNPLISVNFNLQKAFLEDHRYGGFELLSAPSQSPGVVYDLSFIMVGRPSGWRMSIEYNSDLFDVGTVRTLLALWQETYEIALANPDVLLSSLSTPARHIPLPEIIDESTAPLERMLKSHASLSDAAVVEREGRIHAFVTPNADLSEPLDRLPAILMQYLAQRLPADGLPEGVSILLALPKTESGAINRDRLRIPAPIDAGQPVTRPDTLKVQGPDQLGEKITALAAIWSELLNAPSVTPGDDFFALGGHSLLALRMLSAVHTRFGVKPTLESLFKEPTLGGFAAKIFDLPKPVASIPVYTPAVEDQPSPWELVTCKTGTGGLTVYTLNHPFLFYRLANELPEAVSVYNVNMFNANLDAGLRDMSFGQIARHAIEAMNIDKDAGPVAVVGLCVNGVLAMEVTRQLREAGNDVSFTALIDAWAPGFVRSQPKVRQRLWKIERRAKRLVYFTQKLLSGRMSILTYLKEFNFTLWVVQKFGVTGSEYSHEEVANATVTDLLVAAARGYRAVQTKDERVILLRSEAQPSSARKLLFGWGEAVATTTPVLDINGWHEDSLTSDGIRQLASIVSGKLEKPRR